jgi:uncharacterized protein YkwD
LPPLTFIAILVVTGIGIRYAERRAMRRLTPAVHVHTANRIGGALVGVLTGFVVASVIAALVMALPLPRALRDDADRSALVERLASATDGVESALSPIIRKPIEETLTHILVRPETSERVDLPFRVNSADARPDLEKQMLVLVNAERRSRGLDTLVADPLLKVVARLHSADMFRRGYFAHDTPDGIDPFARMRAAHVRYRFAGENLALATTLRMAHRGLMNSPGHRENILNGHYGHVGIGVLDGGVDGLMISQEFRD